MTSLTWIEYLLRGTEDAANRDARSYLLPLEQQRQVDRAVGAVSGAAACFAGRDLFRFRTFHAGRSRTTSRRNQCLRGVGPPIGAWNQDRRRCGRLGDGGV